MESQKLGPEGRNRTISFRGERSGRSILRRLAARALGSWRVPRTPGAPSSASSSLLMYVTHAEYLPFRGLALLSLSRGGPEQAADHCYFSPSHFICCTLCRNLSSSHPLFPQPMAPHPSEISLTSVSWTALSLPWHSCTPAMPEVSAASSVGMCECDVGEMLRWKTAPQLGLRQNTSILKQWVPRHTDFIYRNKKGDISHI